jgi:hypothetical protein
METIPILLPIAASLFLFQTVCIFCLHRRVNRLETMPTQQVLFPDVTSYGVPIHSLAPAPVPVPAQYRLSQVI